MKIVQLLFFVILFIACNNSNQNNQQKVKLFEVQDSVNKDKKVKRIDENREFEKLVWKYICKNNLDSLQKINLRDREFSRRFKYSINGFEITGVEEYCDSNTFKYLIESNVRVFENERDSAYSLLIAIDHNNESLIDFWLNNGNVSMFKKDIELGMEDIWFISPFGRILEKGDFILLQKFLDNGVKYSYKDLIYANDESFRFVLSALAQSNEFQVDSLVKTFQECINTGKVNKVKQLLKQNVDVNWNSEKGVPMLHYAVSPRGWPNVEYLDERYEIARLLLKHGANINSIDMEGNKVFHNMLGYYSEESVAEDSYTEKRIKFIKLFSNYGLYYTKNNKGETFYSMIQEPRHKQLAEFSRNNKEYFIVPSVRNQYLELDRTKFLFQKIDTVQVPPYDIYKKLPVTSDNQQLEEIYKYYCDYTFSDHFDTYLFMEYEGGDCSPMAVIYTLINDTILDSKIIAANCRVESSQSRMKSVFKNDSTFQVLVNYSDPLYEKKLVVLYRIKKEYYINQYGKISLIGTTTINDTVSHKEFSEIELGLTLTM
jgi:ankyrin repeat protein